MQSSARALTLAAILAVTMLSGSAPAVSKEPAAAAPIPALAVHKNLGPPPRGVTELKFHDMFKLPIGPRGLEPSATLSALDGKRVRVVGYMAQQEPLPTAAFLLAPLPVQISDEDEPLADDLPPSTISVGVPGAETKAIRWLPGLIQVTGVLHVGARADETTGRVSSVRIVLEAPLARALLAAPVAVRKTPTRDAQARAIP